jgi:hypothetical protein
MGVDSVRVRGIPKGTRLTFHDRGEYPYLLLFESERRSKMSRGSSAALAGLLIGLAALPASAGDPSRPVQLTPGANQVLRAGAEVAIRWEAELPGCTRNFFGEQEINLSLDGGRSFPYRITPRLAYDERGYVWRVPNLPTDQAVLDLRYGCENEPGECEPNRTIIDALNPQYDSPFRIVATTADFVGHPVLSAPKDARPGDRIALKWQARVADLDHYEILASVDRGGQFELIGTTPKAAFSWALPVEGIRCSYFFKVAAVRTDGSRIESVVDTTQMVYVGYNR